MASTELAFADEAQCKGTIADVRNNETSTNWVLFTYSDSSKNTIIFLANGSGGVEELKTHLVADKICYGLLRVTNIIDNSVTVKFVFIIWCGEQVPFMTKAKMTTHKGSIVNLVGQFHTDLFASNLGEISEEIIMTKVKDASGTSHHVKESSPSIPTVTASVSTSTRAAQSTGVPRATGSAKPPAAPSTTSIIQFVDEDSCRNAINAVRSDRDETDWCLFTYDGNSNKIILLGKGDDGLDGLVQLLKEDQIMYGLYRTTDTIDNTIAVKFVYIVWVGDKVPIIRKARITTHKGEITSFIGQYHVDLNCSNLNEINEDIIRDLVQRASGTAIHVK